MKRIALAEYAVGCEALILGAIKSKDEIENQQIQNVIVYIGTMPYRGPFLMSI